MNIITVDEFTALNLNVIGAVFVSGLPIDTDLCSEIKLGNDGYAIVCDLLTLVDKTKNEIVTRKINGNVTIQLKNKDIDNVILENMGLKIKTEYYQDQEKHLLVAA